MPGSSAAIRARRKSGVFPIRDRISVLSPALMMEAACAMSLNQKELLLDILPASKSLSTLG
jgi:hypothetical protein